MAVEGIKNFDNIERKLRRLGEVMGKEALNDGMDAALDRPNRPGLARPGGA